jgi:Putative motility protein
MNISNTPGVQAATAAAQAETADAVNILVLKKALDMQAVSAATLLQALPAAPQLANSGSLGTRINAFA